MQTGRGGRAALLALALGLGPSAPLAAQGEPLAPGREARLHVRGLIAPLEGTLLELGREAVRIETREGVLSVSRSQVELAEVLASRGNEVRGALIGVGVGLAVGILAVIRSRDDCERTVSGFCAPVGDRVNLWLLAIPPVAGAAVGAVIGSRVRSSHWIVGYFPPPGSAALPTLGVGVRVPAGI